MYLDFSKLEFDAFGRPEYPELMLETLGGRRIGVLTNVSDLNFEINFSELSEMTFTIASCSDGVDTPHYRDVTGHKRIYTKNYGVYVIMNPESDEDGIQNQKNITAYSLEKTLEVKKFFLEEGTFNFWNPADPTDTVLGRILEIAKDWKAGYVSPTLIGRYRTFDEYDDYLLSFAYGSAMEKYHCVFVFDTYEMSINVYDADENRETLPIYLSFENLLKEAGVKEISDELVTALRPYGADELNIMNVNPTGTNWLYDISYFIENGDVEPELAEKWKTWQQLVLSRQEYYRGLVAMRASGSARLIALRAELVDLKAEKEDLENQQSIAIQTKAAETTDVGKTAQQAVLNKINADIKTKQAEVEAKELEINTLNKEVYGEDEDSYSSKILAVVNELGIEKYFTEEEYKVLSRYFIEQDLTEETFVASSVGAETSGQSYKLSGETINITGSVIAEIALDETSEDRIYTLKGGRATVTGTVNMSFDIIRATMDLKEDNSCVFSVYAGSITVGEHTAESGMITINGTISNLQSDITETTTDGITESTGTQISFGTDNVSLYMTSNVSEYQKYSVQMELYDYAVTELSEKATPTYEFDVESGNILFAREFDAFRQKIKLGSGVYLNMSDGVITPILIGLQFGFEDLSEFTMTFSNRFKRHDSVNTLKDMIEKSYSSSRSFEASKYIYGKTTDKTTQVSQFMSGSLDAAVNNIYGAANQSVMIGANGIEVGGDSDQQLRIVNNMICITDDNWQTAKLALGYFSTPEYGSYYGINGEVIAGKLLVGNNLVVENVNDSGVMQFKVDAMGAWLNNATFVLQKDDGGKILLSPEYGLVAGTEDLFTTDGTTVLPSFIGEDGNVVTDEDGIPEKANFFLDLRDGNAYFRGNVYATDGVFNGTVYATDGKFTGTVYATDGEFTGKIHATDGEFTGTIKGASLEGKLVGGANSALEGISLDVGNGNFVVDSSGNVTMAGDINMDGKIVFGGTTYSDFQSAVRNVQTDTVGLTSLSGYKIYKTSIGSALIESPTIEGNEIKVYGSFQTYDSAGEAITGYMGYAQGATTDGDGGTITTHGVALSTTNAAITTTTQEPYVIVTTAGARMSAGNYAFLVTSKGVFYQVGTTNYNLEDMLGGTATFG